MGDDVWHSVWDDSLSLDIPEIDEEHRRFISLVNALNDAITSRQEESAIQRALGLVVADARNHFEHEECLLSEHGYPEANYHAAIHAELTRQLLGVMDDYDNAGWSYDWFEKALLFKKLVVDHVMQEDMKYRAFLKSRLG